MAALADLGEVGRLVSGSADLVALAGIILPGGESTTLSILLESSGLLDPLAAALGDGLPVFGTCAGMILLAETVLDGRPDQRRFGVIDITPVSYTHLRAHETGRKLVCRLLLEKKK